MTVESNLKKIVSSGIDISYSVTVGATNILHMPDMHAWLVENNLLDTKNPSRFRLHSVVRPAHISTKIIPLPAKEKIAKTIRNYCGSLKEKNIYHEGWDFLIDYMMSADHSNLLPKFKEHHRHLDSLRGQSIYDAFPEIREWCI